jgi:hypothetical protein
LRLPWLLCLRLLRLSGRLRLGWLLCLRRRLLLNGWLRLSRQLLSGRLWLRWLLRLLLRDLLSLVCICHLDLVFVVLLVEVATPQWAVTV